MEDNEKSNRKKKPSDITETSLAFRMADKEKTGYLSKSEFTEMAKNLSQKQIDKVFNVFDKDGDGKIDYEEFSELMSQGKRK